MIVVVFRAAKT